MSTQMCKVDNLPFWVVHGSPDHVDSLSSVALTISDISAAKMALFGISRESQFHTCNQSEPCASPQRARDEEHLYRREKEVGRTVKTSVHAFQWLSPCQEGRRVFLLPAALCYCCNLNYQSYQRLSTGDHTGLLQSTVGGDGFPLSDRTLFRASAILSEDPHSSFGKCYHHMFLLFVRSQYWEHMWQVQVLITRKLWSRL